jgi:hypothetical protein
LSRRSLQDTNVSSDPSIGWKALASKLEEIWSKEFEEADGNSCHQQKDKLRKALDTTLQNMKSLEELMVKFKLKFGITADTEVDQQESSMAKLPTTSSIPDRNEVFFQVCCTDSDLKLPMETDDETDDTQEIDESAEEEIIIECDSKKSQKGKEVKEETKKTKKRPIQSDSDFQSSESKKEKKKPKKKRYSSQSDEVSDCDGSVFRD